MEIKRKKLYSVWNAMINRCKNPKNKGYHNYGGRGINVCDTWVASFDAFYSWALENGYSVGLQLDRMSNNGHYEPCNCRFTNTTVQVLNRRKMKDTKNIEKGIYFIEKNLLKPYKVYVYFKYKSKVVGYYKTVEEAVTARNNYIKENNIYGDSI